MRKLRSGWRFVRAAGFPPLMISPLFLLAVLAFLLVNPASPAAFGDSQPTRFDVEAVYLYQFGNFVQWPSNPTKTDRPKSFSVCVLGQDPFGRILDTTLSGSKIDGLPMSARRITTVREARDCQIVFISPSRRDQLNADLSALQNIPVLTVSDIPDFASRGGMIQFLLVDNRVRFEINLSSAQKAGLKLSSQLLKVAVGVRGGRKLKE